MSNYPPGVTGNEPQIAGYPTGVVDRECGFESEETDESEGLICAFEGKVDVEYAEGFCYWTCPSCGHEHEEEQPSQEDDYEDRDDDRDDEEWMK